MWTRIGNWIIGLLWLGTMLCPINGLAEDISFEATVNSNKISLQDMLELTLTVHGAKGDIPIIPLPPIDGFDGRFVGPATRYMIVNGVSSSERSFIYNLFPSKVGHYQIPSMSVTIDGQTYQSAPIDIEVQDKPVAQPSETDIAAPLGDSTINDKVFMKSFIKSKDVYVGEKTPLMMKVYVNNLSLQLATAPYLTPDGFVADTTAMMRKEKEVLNGVNYDVLRFDTNLYPTRSGTIQVGPFVAQGELVYRIKETNDILGDFFARTQSRPITLDAPAIQLNVLALPLEGQPKDYSGAVGQYDFKANVGPQTVKVGDPLTLRMTFSGQGRIKDVVAPVLSDSRFKMYDAQIKEDENGKTIEQVIIPTVQEITEVPALSFSYFDPQEKKYKTITQGPFPIKVLAPAPGEEFKAYGFIDKTKATPDKPDLIKLDGLQNFYQKFVKKVVSLVKNLFFWICLVIAGIVWFCFYIWGQFQNRLQKDEVFAREWKAEAKAKELLRSSKKFLQQHNSKEFYSSIYKAVNDYLADKMHVPLASLDGGMIETYLKKHSIDVSKLQIIKDVLERCDLVRFASAEMSNEQMLKDFDEINKVLDYLPKVLK